jgi:hypothetical protein
MLAKRVTPGKEKRSIKGLKTLSIRVRELVQERKKVTYKQVADSLIDELTRKSNTKVAPKDKKDDKVSR